MEQERILKKNEIVFSDTLGVCKVAEVSSLNGKCNTYQYYKLGSVFNKDKFCYLPTVGHQMKLREIISVDEVEKLCNSSDFEEMGDLQKEEIEYVLSNK